MAIYSRCNYVLKFSQRAVCGTLLAFAAAAAVCAEEPAAYKVRTGDVLRINVMNHDEFSNTFTVAPDGTINFPMLGQLSVADRVLSDINKDVTTRLSKDYLKYPTVTTTLEKPNSPKVSIYGEVKTPGEYALTEKSVTVLQMLTMAGGVAKTGSETKVTVLRPKADGSSYETIKVDLKSVIAGSETDPVLLPRDIVVVRQGWF